MDNIVVQTTAGAQRCLEFLRKHNLGRANFIPLDKMKKGAHDRVVETPEGAPRLYDLINPVKPFIAPAIFLAVSDTLVAPDLETATRWAYDYSKRWRVVTLDGKLIEASGTMAGGGKSVRRGGMQLFSGRSKMALADEEDDAADVKTLQEEAAKAQQLLQECRKGRKELLEEIRLLKKNVKVLETKLPKLTVEIGGCDTTRTELTKFIPELRSQSKLNDADAAKLLELNHKVAKCKTDMSSCTMKAAKLEAEVARLQKAIMDAGGSKLKKQQADCEKALSKLNAAEKALNTAKVSITSMTKAATKAQKAKVDAEKELEQCLAKTEELHIEFKSLEADAFKVMEEFEKAKAVEVEAKEAFEEACKECEDLKKSQTENKFVEVELVGKIEDLQKQMADSERKQNKWEADLSKLRAAAEEEDDFDMSDDEAEDGDDKSDRSSKANDDVEIEDAHPDEVPEEPKGKEKQPKSSLPTYSPEALEKYDKDDIMRDITVLETERNSIAKHANMGAIAEYRKKEADYLARYDLGSYCALYRFAWILLTLLLWSIRIVFAVSQSLMVSPKNATAREDSTKTFVACVLKCSWTASGKSL